MRCQCCQCTIPLQCTVRKVYLHFIVLSIPPTCLPCHSHRWNTACSPLVELARQCNWKGWQCTGIGAAISVVPPVQYAVMQLQCATTSCQPSLGCSACGGATAVQYNMLPIKVDWSAVTQTYILWPPWAVSDEAWQTKQPWCLDSHWWLRPGFESRNLWSACLLDADAYAVPLRSCHPVPSVTVPPKLKVCALLFPPAPKCCWRVVRSCSWSWSHDGLATSFFEGLSATLHTSVIRTQQTLLWLKELHLSALSHAGHDQRHQSSLMSQICPGHCVSCDSWWLISNIMSNCWHRSWSLCLLHVEKTSAACKQTLS